MRSSSEFLRVELIQEYVDESLSQLEQNCVDVNRNQGCFSRNESQVQPLVPIHSFPAE